MADLIDRANLKADVERDKKDRSGMTDCAFKEGFACGLELALERIENAPVADAEPVVHAYWIHTEGGWGDNGNSRCSHCRCEVSWGQGFEPPGYSHCPNCGARMDADDLLKPTKHDAPERAGKDGRDG